MKRLMKLVLVFLVTGLGLPLFLGNCPQVMAQPVDDAVGWGTVSLPDPTTPGITSVTGPGLSVGVPAGSAIHGTNVRAAGGPGTGTQAEISMAVSGPSIVITFNGGPTGGSGFVTSLDGGVTFSPMASFPSPAGSSPCCDPGIVADSLGRFYFVQLYRDDGAGNCTNSLQVSTDGGQTFSSIIGSPFSFASGTTHFPDMPHIGIDRIHLVNSNPQLYVFSRHFTSGINCPQTGTGGTTQGEVVCSTNGGTTWTAPSVLSPFMDLAHWATGSDGSVYLVGNGTGTLPNTARILLRRSTKDCNTGLSFGSPVVVADNLTFGSAGIDREFPQPFVAGDKLNPNIVFVAWSSDRLKDDTDRDIFLARCTFSGTAGSCEPPIRVNDNPIADNTAQYFPMLCVDPNNTINLAWHDQRAGGGQTAIYQSEISTAGGALSAGPNFLVSEASFVPQDFAGTPDYGDYNENNDACDGSHFYVAWPSQVSPPGITPASNDVDIFFAVVNNLQDIRVKAPLDFGNVCLDHSQDRQLEIFNVGDQTLTVNSISRVSGSSDITLIDSNPTLPLKIGPDGHVDFEARCSSTAFGPKTATFRILSDDPDQPTIDLAAACNTPPGELRVAGSADFTNVCFGALPQAEKRFSVCDVGACNLNVTSVAFSPACSDFTLVNNPFPAPVSPGSCLDVIIRFTPTSLGTKTCTLVIASDDPITPSKTVSVTGNTPAASVSIGLPPDQTFVPTGIQSTGACSSSKPFPIANTGTCDQKITNITIDGVNAGDFSFSGLPSFPLFLQPGNVVGDGALKTVFAPNALGRNRQGTVSVTYISDPITSATTTVTRNLCGEGVMTGARVLVTRNGVPLSSVKKIHMQRIGLDRHNKKILDTIDNARNVSLQTVTQTAPCASFQFHREYGTVGNPIQLLPGNYELVVTAKIDGKNQKKNVAFEVTTCTFNQNIVVNF